MKKIPIQVNPVAHFINFLPNYVLISSIEADNYRGKIDILDYNNNLNLKFSVPGRNYGEQFGSAFTIIKVASNYFDLMVTQK